MKLRGKTILITGGTSGIGLELARQLLALGNTVIVTGRSQPALDAAVRTLPGVHAIRSDVGDPAQIVALYDEVTTRFPQLDTLFNNAGVMRKLDFNAGTELDGVTHEIDVNFSGPVRMVQQFVPHLKKQSAALIVNVTSVLASVPIPASPVYCATKAALHSFTQSLRVQLAGSSVTVVELAPPAVETPMLLSEYSREMKGQSVMNTAALARETIAGIQSGKSIIRPGLSKMLNLLSRIAPQFTLNQMVRSMRPQH